MTCVGVFLFKNIHKMKFPSFINFFSSGFRNWQRLRQLWGRRRRRWREHTFFLKSFYLAILLFPMSSYLFIIGQNADVNKFDINRKMFQRSIHICKPYANATYMSKYITVLANLGPYVNDNVTWKISEKTQSLKLSLRIYSSYTNLNKFTGTVQKMLMHRVLSDRYRIAQEKLQYHGV